MVKMKHSSCEGCAGLWVTGRAFKCAWGKFITFKATENTISKPIPREKCEKALGIEVPSTIKFKKN